MKRKELRALTGRQQELVSSHLYLVGIVACCIQRGLNLPAHVQFSELEAAGNYGLVDASTRYDETKPVQFRAYAKWRIKGAIFDWLREQDWLSRDVRRGKKAVDRAFEDLRQQLQRDPDDDELASKLGMTVERWRFVRLTFAYGTPVSGSEIVVKSRGGIAALKPDYSDGAEQHPGSSPAIGFGAESSLSTSRMFRNVEMAELIGAAVRTLPERYREIIRLYYSEELSMKEIGDRLGVGESRVSQVHQSALNKMRAQLAKQGIPSLQAFDLAA